jgi:hypothetical protein
MSFQMSFQIPFDNYSCIGGSSRVSQSAFNFLGGDIGVAASLPICQP